MTAVWFDPISQRMRRMPADKVRVEIHDPVTAKEGLSLDQERTWRAVVATATSTTIAAPAEEEEICF